MISIVGHSTDQPQHSPLNLLVNGLMPLVTAALQKFMLDYWLVRFSTFKILCCKMYWLKLNFFSYRWYRIPQQLRILSPVTPVASHFSRPLQLNNDFIFSQKTPPPPEPSDHFNTYFSSVVPKCGEGYLLVIWTFQPSGYWYRSAFFNAFVCFLTNLQAPWLQWSFPNNLRFVIIQPYLALHIVSNQNHWQSSIW